MIRVWIEHTSLSAMLRLDEPKAWNSWQAKPSFILAHQSSPPYLALHVCPLGHSELYPLGQTCPSCEILWGLGLSKALLLSAYGMIGGSIKTDA